MQSGGIIPIVLRHFGPNSGAVGTKVSSALLFLLLVLVATLRLLAVFAVLLEQLRKHEQEQGIVPDPELEAIMDADATPHNFTYGREVGPRSMLFARS